MQYDQIETHMNRKCQHLKIFFNLDFWTMEECMCVCVYKKKSGENEKATSKRLIECCVTIPESFFLMLFCKYIVLYMGKYFSVLFFCIVFLSFEFIYLKFSLYVKWKTGEKRKWTNRIFVYCFSKKCTNTYVFAKLKRKFSTLFISTNSNFYF